MKLGNREGGGGVHDAQSEGRSSIILLLDDILCLASGSEVSSPGDEVGMYSDDYSTEG